MVLSVIQLKLMTKTRLHPGMFSFVLGLKKPLQTLELLVLLAHF